MKYLVTGGAGFIGSHVCELLLASGQTVRVLDNLSSGDPSWLPSSVELITGDICDKDALTAAADGSDVIVHLAAMSRSAPSGGMLDECIRSNVNGVVNLIEVVTGSPPQRIVFAASSTYYGSGEVPNTVGSSPDFLNYYGVTKYVGEALLGTLSRAAAIPVTNLRFFNVYGPRQPTEGEYALVIGQFLRAAQRNEPLVVHGDGSQRRDFVHVRDVARAISLASTIGAGGCQTFNVGTGTNTSIIELAKMISPEIEFGPRRSGDAKDTLADIAPTTAALGWRPEIGLTEGLEELRSLGSS